MVQTCLGIFAVLALFTFLTFIGTLYDAQRGDKIKYSK